jgi:hypothetical protein
MKSLSNWYDLFCITDNLLIPLLGEWPKRYPTAIFARAQRVYAI